MRAKTYFEAYVRCRNILSFIDLKRRRRRGSNILIFADSFSAQRWRRHARLTRKLEAKLLEILPGEGEEA